MAESVLIVHDSASIRLTVKIALERAGFAVTEAAKGAEGIAAAQTGRFDLVLTDLNIGVTSETEAT
jgi:two-component system chemotaxis response regulator CheY